MSNIIIRDLAADRELDPQALSAVRGGFDFKALQSGSLVNVDFDLDIAVNQYLNMPISILNGSVIGAPLSVGVTATPRLIAAIG